jgi:hypothetical protein
LRTDSYAVHASSSLAGVTKNIMEKIEIPSSGLELYVDKGYALTKVPIKVGFDPNLLYIASDRQTAKARYKLHKIRNEFYWVSLFDTTSVALSFATFEKALEHAWHNFTYRITAFQADASEIKIHWRQD